MAARSSLGIAVVVALATSVVLTVGFVGYQKLTEDGPITIEIGDHDIVLPRLGRPAERTMHVIYLERHGLTLTGGDDDSTRNRSSVVHGSDREQVTIPAFAGSDARWRDIVTCLRDEYSRFDVEIVEERPEERGYVLVVVGGTPDLLGAKKRVGGLAPFNTEQIPDPVVFVFSRALKEQTRAVCETAAMEIAHTYGLDHEHTCHDPMGYLGGCGARRFQDKEVPCGELKERVCADGQPTQNSVARLREALGPRRR